MRKIALTAVGLALAFGASAQAGDLITNGSFSGTTGVAVPTVEGAGFSGIEIDPAYIYGNDVTAWTSAGGSAFNLLFFGGSTNLDADTRYTFESGIHGGEPGQHPNANYTSAGDGDGGAFLVLDGDPGFSGAISQTVTGLVAGHEYQLSFYWAAGELADRTGYQHRRANRQLRRRRLSPHPTFVNSHPFDDNPLNLPGDFSGWELMKLDFTAHSTSQVLSFLAVGTPAANLPPVAFLDGVHLVEVPGACGLGPDAAGLRRPGRRHPSAPSARRRLRRARRAPPSCAPFPFEQREANTRP